MPDDDRPPEGLTFWEAVREFSDPELLAAHDRAHDADRRLSVGGMHIGKIGGGGVSRFTREYNAKKQAYRRSLNAVLGDFWDLVKTTGAVTAIGCCDSVDEPKREIPRAEWRWLPDRPGKDGATFEGNGRTWYRVLFHRREDLEAWRTHRRAGARMTDEQLGAPELDAAEPKYPGLWNEGAWRAGVRSGAIRRPGLRGGPIGKSRSLAGHRPTRKTEKTYCMLRPSDSYVSI